MPPKRRAHDGILGGKGDGNWGPLTRHPGWKRAGRVVGGVQQPARYPTGRVAMPEIIKYRRDGGYIIPKVPFYRLYQEIVSELALEQQFHGRDQRLNASRWQRKTSW